MRCPALAELPPPPPGKTGWPWTVDTPPLPETRPDGTPWPRISIVTPSYNQGQFIEETIRSVLLQGYPDLEYIIMDGASSDESADIIKKYAPWLAHWESGRDKGQADAINKGFRKTSGRILNWLNSDDTLQPRGLWCVASIDAEVPEADLIAGARLLKCVEGFGYYAQTSWLSAWREYQLGFADFPQEATFFSRRVWDQVGGVEEAMRYHFDVLFFNRALRFARVIATTHFPISCMLTHREMKTLTADKDKSAEDEIVYKDLAIGSVVRRLLAALSRTRLYSLYPILVTALSPRARRVKVMDYSVLDGKWLPGHRR
jgi:glycosyltransferase involved in cell wall biosynthesis